MIYIIFYPMIGIKGKKMIKDNQPHKNSAKSRFLKPKKKYSGIWICCLVFLDAASLILAFYIINSPIILKPGINITLPKSSFSDGAIYNGSTLSIAQNGLFFYKDEIVNESKLKKYLLDEKINNPNMTLIIEVDENAKHSKLVQAWTLAHDVGIKEISIATGLYAKKDH